MRKSEFILSRHAEKILEKTSEEEKSEKYQGITKEGERKSREKTKEIADIIDDLPDGSVTVLSGISKALRTRATLEVYADELHNIFKDRENIIFSSEPKFGEKEDENLAERLGELRVISQKMKENTGNVKAIVQFPIWIKQFTSAPEAWDKWAEYFKTIKIQDKKYQTNDTEIAQWLDAKKGVNPDELSKNLLLGLKREEEFFRRFFPDNTIAFINVTHSGELDALFTHLANNSEITKEGFEKIGGEIVKENEFGKLSFSPDGNIEFEYRGKRFSYKINDENKKS
jgi:hypothetical protein